MQVGKKPPPPPQAREQGVHKCSFETAFPLCHLFCLFLPAIHVTLTLGSCNKSDTYKKSELMFNAWSLFFPAKP